MYLHLEVKYLHLEKTRNKLLNDLEKLDETVLHTVPEPGKWSMAQVVAHLVLVDQFTVSSIRHKLQQPGLLRPATFRTRLNSLLLKLALKSWLKFKAPARVAIVPEKTCFQALRKKWDLLRFELEDLLAALPEDALDKCLFKHPIAGPLTISQTLHFLQDHFDHHLQQVHQLRKLLKVEELQKKHQ